MIADHYPELPFLSDGFDHRVSFRRAHRAYTLEDSAVLEGMLASCAALPEEVQLQARATDHCSPYPLNGEHWAQNITEFTPSKRYFAEAVTMMARHGEMPIEDRFRLVVQGMAVGRDLSPGPAGFSNAESGAKVENWLSAALVSLLEENAPSPVLRVELEEALRTLANMPIDVHSLFAAHAILEVDRSKVDTEHREHWTNFNTFAAADFVLQIIEKCPLGSTTKEVCFADFPRDVESPRSTIVHAVFGPRLQRNVYLSFYIDRDFYVRELATLEVARGNQEALLEVVRWSVERAETGRCPELAPWSITANDGLMHVDRADDLYRLVTPDESAFYFRCSPRAESDAPVP